jgi:VanZ family protein
MTTAIEAGPGTWLKLAAVAVFIVLAAWAANGQR